MSPEELRAWLILLRAPQLSPRTLLGLIQEAGGAGAAVGAARRFAARFELSSATVAALLTPDEALLSTDLAWCETAGRGLLPITDPRYPSRLRQIPGAPAALFHRGDLDLLEWPQIAIVGSRNATPQGLEIARDFAAEIARRGLLVTSGLALGIDSAAHRGALDAGEPTVAVCGTGLDRVYPARHKALAEAIEKRGVLISEFPPGTVARPAHFPQRNRILSGLSLGVLVVEAARESGSLITARFAGEQGREVFAVPGSIHNPMARGCHYLIRQGAKLVETADDILEEIGPQVGAWLREKAPTSAPAPSAAGAGPSPAQQRVLDAVGDRPLSIDSLVAKLGTPIQDVTGALTELELAGHVAAMPGGRVMRTHGVKS